MYLLAFSLVAALTPADERVLPSLDYATKTPAEWMQAFESSDPKSAEPLWCLYWSDARTPDVIDFLLRQRTELSDRRPYVGMHRPRNLAREIDAILIQWNAQAALLPPQWDSPHSGAVLDKSDRSVDMLFELGVLAASTTPAEPTQRWYRVPSGLFPLPTPILDDSDAALLARLDSRDRLEQTEAAVTLIVRRKEVARAMRALALRVADDRDHGLRGENGAKALMGDNGDGMEAYYACTWHMREPCVLQVFPLEHVSAYAFEWATGVLGTAGARTLADMIRAGGTEAHAVDAACAFGGAPATHWTPAAQAIIASVHPTEGKVDSQARWLESEAIPADPPRGTRMFHAAGSAPYGHFVSPWKGVAETKDSRTQRVLQLGESMSASLERGVSLDEDLRRLLAVLRAPYGETGADGPNDCYQAGLWILDALHVTSADAADWCVGILLDPHHFDVHLEIALEILGRCSLSLRQQALAVQASDNWMEDPRAAFFAGLGAAAIERSARLRTYAQGWSDMPVLHELLKIARPSSQDLEMVAAALDRGYASDRVLALAILDEHVDMASSALRSIATRACDDLDDTVREAARALKAKRGW